MLMIKEKTKKNSFGYFPREPRLIPAFEEANISAGIMKKQESPMKSNVITSIGYFVLPLYGANYYCTHENIITRAAENVVFFGGAAILLATVYVGWKEFVAEGQRLIEEKYDRCFKNGNYPCSKSDAAGRKEFEEYCIWKYGELPEIKRN